MDRGNSDPKDLDDALVAFIMNSNEFSTNLAKRVSRQCEGKVVENARIRKGSNQWGLDLYEELQWLDDQEKQQEFVLLRDYVKSMSTRGPRPNYEMIRQDVPSDNDAVSRPERHQSKARGNSSMSEAEGFLERDDEGEDEDKGKDKGDLDPRRDYSEYYSEDNAYLPPSTQLKPLILITALLQRIPLPSSLRTHAVTTADRISSTPDPENQQQTHEYGLVVR